MNCSKISCLFVFAILFSNAQAIQFKWGPVIEHASQTSLQIRATTDSAADVILNYGIVFVTENNDTISNTDSAVFALSGLVPNQVYQYTLYAGNATRTATFRTLPARGQRAHVATHGDVQGSGFWFTYYVGPSMLMQDSLDAFNAYIMTGDYINNGNAVEWDSYFNHSRLLLDHIPSFPVWGNHDVGGDMPIYNVFPEYNPLNKLYYSFDAGNAHFSVVDGSCFRNNTAQQQWLNNDLDTSTALFKFVFCHYSPIGSGSYGMCTYAMGQIMPILDAHNVDAYFAGHKHSYERSKPVCYGPGSPDSGMLCDNGTYFFIAGNSGQNLWDDPATWPTAFDTGAYHGYVDIVVEDSVARIQSMGANWPSYWDAANDWQLTDGMYFSKQYDIMNKFLVFDSVIIDKRHESSAREKGMNKTTAPWMEVSPNPFNPTARIAVSSPRFARLASESRWAGEAGGQRAAGGEKTEIYIFNVHGKLVQKMPADFCQLTSGITWDASDLPSGVYVIKAMAGNVVLIKMATLLK
ncbi:MAG: hypothetical protein A2487_03720 [Candidatus Raymondbacteria bacterium RifOxyC12_full_50_8]|uniref:Calcineurin-like phosphoesterase domain-containing protein n=1 Tax=Candidatus Raymondbacteria bacterium RIFOXYD12_FULL_49_13 TaxID=1817890 RepID=A0A1F7FJ18_UNCRA|nr:MAG: hypothetical protein A2248_10210 [Candidatus Raymondbacteria bacterium RIFOXYA2_FULL_49_16]OGJ99617.1 MAG: hypothetical protein A2350_06035 [Candidatus Raymondbacteria bacterium RifOxyB12_full_50_8]OGK06633.1 MAG: hypothetical protein A2519_11010 [Candidatus Raymondbacteria bacterium RIFOXYD12_FULL_49_13]OGK06687.1 MAG: hypothetical protein A2487_03720 [Candidatus Raymondbacteria bacterium RifOxyC12_full_50_8]OGP43427.1 MAG: hypothetical protein A2324_20030 [Candidatus Raymondbacteria b